MTGQTIRAASTPADRSGYTLLEIIIALGLGTLVVGLVGALFLFSSRTWRRGNDLREVQIQATLVADVIARDVRAASRAGVALHPDLTMVGGTPLLSISAAPENADATWIVYVLDEARGEVRRLVIRRGEDGPLVEQSRPVAQGVTRVDLQPADGGMTIDVEARRGGAVFRLRRTAAPQNP